MRGLRRAGRVHVREGRGDAPGSTIRKGTVGGTWTAVFIVYCRPGVILTRDLIRVTRGMAERRGERPPPPLPPLLGVSMRSESWCSPPTLEPHPKCLESSCRLAARLLRLYNPADRTGSTNETNLPFVRRSFTIGGKPHRLPPSQQRCSSPI